MSRRLSLLAYNLLLPLAMLAILPGYILKLRRRGKPEGHVRQRFGFYSDKVEARLGNLDRPIWLHAVSVGEVGVAKRIIDMLRVERPDISIVLSTTTTTGNAVARERCGDAAEVIFNPIDFRFSARRALRLIRPRALVLVEAEVWPNLVSLAKRSGLPVMIANMRLSPRSERRFRRFGFLIRPIFSLIDRAFVQHPDDIKRCAGLGIDHDRIECTGSVKFDPSGDTAPSRAGEFRQLADEFLENAGAPVLLAASTHAGEEKFIGEIVARLRKDFSSLAYFVAPRHFERTGEVEADLKQVSLSPVRRTAMTGKQGDTLIIDTTGELRDWFAVADLVIIGKSFLGEGGQNPVEAIVAGKPVLFGPHMQNFPQLTHDLVATGSAIQAADGPRLEQALRDLLVNPDRGKALAASANRVLDQHHGAVTRTVDGILAMIG